MSVAAEREDERVGHPPLSQGIGADRDPLEGAGISSGWGLSHRGARGVILYQRPPRRQGQAEKLLGVHESSAHAV